MNKIFTITIIFLAIQIPKWHQRNHLDLLTVPVKNQLWRKVLRAKYGVKALNEVGIMIHRP